MSLSDIIAAGKFRSIQRSLYSQAGIVAWQIFATQIAGALLILVPSLIMRGGHLTHVNLAWCVGGVTALYYAYVCLPEFLHVVHSEEKLDRYRRGLGFLAVCDTAVILGAIGLSGGIYKSHLGFVLLLIPATVALTRGWGATLQAVSLIILAIVAGETYGLATDHKSLVPSQWGANFFQWIFGFFDAHFDITDPTDPKITPPGRYAAAYAFGVGVGILLTLFQSFLSSGKTFPDRLRMEIEDMIERPLRMTIPEYKALSRSVAKAYHRMSRIASRTSMPEIHSSVVHPLDDVVLQAYILASPGLMGRHGVATLNRRSMRKAAEMVFGVHWLDDAFDYLGFPQHSARIRGSLDITKASCREIGRFYSPHGINRMVCAIKGEPRLAVLRWATRGRPPWEAGVEMGLLRVMLGGFFQHTDPKQKQDAVARVRNDTLALINDRELQSLFKASNTAFLWGITKTDMPLVVGMFWDESDNPNLTEISFVLDTLFMPLLVWHDFEQELIREQIPMGGFDGTGDIRNELREATATAYRILSHARAHPAFTGTVWTAVSPILQLIYSNYGHHMPNEDPYNQYRHFIKNMIEAT